LHLRVFAEILLRRRNGNLATFCRDQCLLDIRRNIATSSIPTNSDLAFSYPEPCSPPGESSLCVAVADDDARE
jgi:hypothetical protein